MWRHLAVTAVLSNLICCLATAAAQERAGVVTTLTGQATVARTAATQSLPLKFKDDVFGRDRIATAEQSLLRVLLGGKALVTVRELSTFTITEEAQRAVVDLHSGKILGAMESPGHWISVTPASEIFIGSLTGNVFRWYPGWRDQR